MSRSNRTLIIAAAALALLVGAVLLLIPRGGTNQDRLSDEQATGAPAPEQRSRCGAQATYDRIKTELFRQAAEVRKSDQAAFDRLSAYASVRMERPLQKSRDEGLGTIRCSGRLSLDLPPGVAVVGGRRTLSADIDYVLQPAADGSGDVVMLEGADAIVVPLATLARTGAPAAPVPSAPAAPPAPPVETAPPPVAPPPPVASGSASPSFNCRHARTSGEVAVCNDPSLAALDRQMAEQYFRALSVAGPRQRAQLTATRTAFLRFRDQCPSESCIAETYRGRMREIRDIMAGTWRPQR